MADTLHVEARNETGSSRMRRLRKQGRIPAILYGHGEANVNLIVKSEELFSVMKHGGKLLTLRGEVADSAGQPLFCPSHGQPHLVALLRAWTDQSRR